jgi:hypothetical protein
LAGVSMALAEKVEGDDGLRDEKIPLVRRVGRIRAGEDGKEVVLKCADSPLGGISTVDMRGYKLEGVSVIHDGPFICFAGLVVKDVHIEGLVGLVQGVDDGLVGWDAVCVRLGDKRAGDNGIGRRVISNHDVLVTATCTYWEAACVVGEEASGRDGQEFQRVGIWAGRDCGVVRVETWFCRPDVLAVLGHVAAAGFIGIGAISCGQCRREAKPCAVVALFDGSDPC